jgi:glycerophosphoryl diester phosphodiesterase
VVRRGTLNIAHRGASGTFPENTLSAFRAAIAAGADMCELDAQRTRDGAIVVIHDDTVNRTTGGRGRVADMTLDELRRLDAAAKFKGAIRGERIPALDEVFETARGKMGINVELKAVGIEHDVSRIMRAHDALGGSMVSSFDWNSLRRMREIDPEVRVGVLAERGATKMIDAAVAMGAFAVNPRHDLVGAELCGTAHARGLQVLVWTVDDPDLMRKLIAGGVDGIMTNYPDRLREVLGR